MNLVRPILIVLFVFATANSTLADGNRLSYLNGPLDPYYVHRNFARLTTPQWVGEANVDAVVVLAIDDMRNPEDYESYLRPILNRLKEIDGRAPVSIMTNRVDPELPLLRDWIEEGLSVEIHTIDHPCPLLYGGDFQRAKQTYDRCVDLMGRIQGNRPVAFRMPCCDSMNTPSPRFWAEIFNKTTSAGNFLKIDSSVFNITTKADAQLDKRITIDSSDRPRFRKYLPFPSFVNTIEDYPFPYVIGNVCWELPCIVPSDWEAQNLHQPNNPQTVTDMKRALDAVVQKQGVYDLVFHPHGWIRSDQVVDLIDYSVEQYGGRIKYLTFREAHDRMSRHLMNGRALRTPSGADAGIRMLDLNGDGWMDLLIPNADDIVTTRVWSIDDNQWQESQQRLPIKHAQYGVVRGNVASFVTVDQERLRQFTYSEEGWRADPLSINSNSIGPDWQRRIREPGPNLVMRLLDIDANGRCELILQDGASSLILQVDAKGQWEPLSFRLPNHIRLSATGDELAWRFIDINGDQRSDIVFSDPNRYAAYLWTSAGWSKIVEQDRRVAGIGPTGKAIPPFVRADGTNNGVWIHSSHLWFQNEDTDRLPDKVDRVSFRELMAAE